MSTKTQVTHLCGTWCTLTEVTARKVQVQLHFISEVKQISIVCSKISMMELLAQVWDSVTSKAIFTSNSVQDIAQESDATDVHESYV